MLCQFRFKRVKWRSLVYESRTNDGRCPDDDGIPETHVELRRDSLYFVSEQTVSHGGVQKHGHYASVKPIGVPLIVRVTGELTDHRAVGLLLEPQPHAGSIPLAAHKARGMTGLTEHSRALRFRLIVRHTLHSVAGFAIAHHSVNLS
jgi:hypothetical protein